ncbi:MAG: flavodoxin family protein [Flavobacteriaceae bacterium]|jgi:multimeric flavodoxin WrbA|nr:flavodoxin family protein [Flavobacteriaceae bacterium]
MKVVAFNGSPREKGNTYQALRVVADELEKEGIEVEIFHVGNKVIRGCMGCGTCRKEGKCIYDNDEVNEYARKMCEADGIIFGSPVHYSGISGTMKSFLDRVFFSTGAKFRHKVGAAVVAVRRTGGISGFEQLLHYLTYAEMVLPTTNYWNVIHGMAPGEAQQDEEGKQIMSILGKNMAWLLKLMEHGKDAVTPPERTKKVFTNFIR